MKPILKLVLIFLAVSVFFLLSFILFQDYFEKLFSYHACREWFASIKPFAWLAGILLLVADIILPIPATGVMASLGAVYGLAWGAFFGIIGSTFAGVAGYGAARLLGPKATHFIASDEEQKKFKAFFDQWGGLAIIISRILPLLPEVLTILAGISGMKPSRFLLALLIGTVPVSFLFAGIGGHSDQAPALGLLISVLVPIVLWPVFLKALKL